MRALASLLALLGVVGVGFGILTVVRGTSGPGGVPFQFENYGGPGAVIAGVILLVGGLYLRSLEPRRG